RVLHTPTAFAAHWDFGWDWVHFLCNIVIYVIREALRAGYRKTLFSFALRSHAPGVGTGEWGCKRFAQHFAQRGIAATKLAPPKEFARRSKKLHVCSTAFCKPLTLSLLTFLF